MRKITLILALLFFFTPVAGLGDSLTAVGPAVKLRAKPGTESKVIAYAGGGKKFTVLKTQGSEWFAVRLPNKELGWVELGSDVKLKRVPVVAKAPVEKTPVTKKKAVVKEVKKKAPPKKKAVEKSPVVAAKTVKPKAKPPPPPPKVEQPKEEKPKGAPPKLISSPEMERIAAGMSQAVSKGPLVAGGFLLLGLICLLIAKFKNRSLIGWFTLGLYFTIIPLIIVLIKKKGSGATPIALKIISIVFIVIWFGIAGGMYMLTQNMMQDNNAIQAKVNIYTLQIYKKNYKRAFLLLSLEGQRLTPYERFVKENDAAYNALGELKHYQLKDLHLSYGQVGVSLPTQGDYQLEQLPVGYAEQPTTVVYEGTFEKGKAQITLNLVKEGGLAGIFRPGEWSISSVKIDSPKILEYKKQKKKEEMVKKKA